MHAAAARPDDDRHRARRRGTGAELGDGALRGVAGQLFDVVACRRARSRRCDRRSRGRSACRCRPTPRRHREQRLDLIVVGPHAVAVGDEDAPAAVHVARRDLGDRRAALRGRPGRPRVSNSTLVALATSAGHDQRPRWDAAPRAAPSRPPWLPPPPLRAAAAAADAAARSPLGERSAVWANPVVSPDTTRMPAPRSWPDTSSSILPSSSTALEERRSSTKISRTRRR